MPHWWERSRIPERHGLQPERTALAWQRTAITATVALVPPLVVDARLAAWVLVVPGLLAAVVAVALVTGVWSRIEQLLDDDSTHSPWWPMWRVAVVTVLAAGGGVVTTLLLLLQSA
ncbi:MAG TPA: DUF202 domain-containing protein [Dermatophilaceae bacterium]|nr:DUF202 domain-containing protein [Dermatophilaceae bacterium]